MFYIGRNNTNHEYNIHNSKLVNATEVVDLGDTVDPNMRFDIHINKIVTKAHQHAALISRCFKSKLEIRSVEHGICPIDEFTSPLLSCAAILAIRP